MSYTTIENRPMHCRTCGAGPYLGKESQTVDRYSGDTIVECQWVCGRCGSHISTGVVSRTPASTNEQK